MENLTGTKLTMGNGIQGFNCCFFSAEWKREWHAKIYIYTARIVKRDGRVVEFDSKRIETAITLLLQLVLAERPQVSAASLPPVKC